MALTELAVKQASPKEKDYKMTDEKGMFLLIKKNGSKYWRLKYRNPHTKKEKVLALGVYPTVGLKQARLKRADAKELLSKGIDPGDHKKSTKSSQGDAAANSFGVITEEWFVKQQMSWAPATIKKHRALLNNDLIPYLESRPISELETWELLGVLNRIIDRGAIDSAHKCRQILNQICRYAKQTGRSKHNPASDLTGALPERKTTHRAAITDPSGFGKLLVDIDAYKGTHIIRTMLALAPLVFQRPGELASMEWSEIDFDGGCWNIPVAKKKERNKREGDHTVPLSKQAQELLSDIRPLTGHHQYVFPNQRDYKKHANTESINKALREMGYNTKEVHCFHGFRASARTMLDEQLGLRVEWIEHQLAHTVKDPLGRAYNRTKHLPQRIDMMQRWSDYLDNLKRQVLAGNVITASFVNEA
jgi:integrase